MAAPPSLAARRAHDRVAQDAGLAEELATELARALQLPGTNRTLGRTFVRYGLAALTLYVAGTAIVGHEALQILYALSYCKMAVTFCKYLPQLLLNYRRRSTVGWPIDNILLDFTGGALSTLQLILDCANQRDWSGISGDVVKFGLGVTSMVFDVLFLVQHYVLYRPVPAGTSEALLDGVDGGEDIVV